MNHEALNLQTVVIVDDDPIMTAITESFFGKRGVERIHTASNGRQALELLDAITYPIDFLLCDLNMPEMDGVQFLRHLKDRRFSGHIAILSGEDDAVVRMAHNLAQTHDLNIEGTLKKPVKLNELEALVRNLCAPAQGQANSSPVLATVNDLRNALFSGDLRPHFQPKVETATGRVAGAEALARWIHPSLGVIGPNFFLPMAEQNGLMASLTNRIINSSLQHMAEWREAKFEPKISINLGAEAIERVDFPDDMAARVRDAGLDCKQIVFEITESQIVAKTATSSEVLTRLRMMGFGISIDDFGTGYSNITQLREFPFTELKIDQSFIRGAAEDPFARTSVEASVNLGKQLDLRLVAEGVETVEQWVYVVSAQVDEVQGYYIAKPMPADEFPGWAQEYERQSPIRAIVGG